MEYDPEYKPIVDFILERLSEGDFPTFSNNDSALMSKLYSEVTLGLVTARGIQARGDMLKTIVTGQKMTVPARSRFFPEDMRKSIIDHQQKQYVYKYKLGDRTFKIVFGLLATTNMSDVQLDLAAQKVCSWLSVCAKYANAKCGINQHIYIYLGGHKKRFPKSTITTIGTSNVNSGFSSICQHTNEIVIYRQEEWFKVFVHETFHSFGFEPDENNERQLSNYMRTILPINPSVRVSEAYVETWARIINAAYAAVLKTSSKEEYLSIVRFSLLVESMFSVIQASRILSFMNISYADVINKTSVVAKTMYKEKTNVFAYYILTAAFMFSPYRFLRWCGNYNTNWLQFNNSPYSVNNFESLINRCLRNRALGQLFIDTASVEGDLKIGLRMSVVEVN